MQFSDLSALVSSGGVEVAQAHVAQSVRAVISFESILEEELRSPIGIHGMPRRILGNGDFLGHSVHCASRGKNKPSHSRVQRGIQQRQSRLCIVLKINPWIQDGFRSEERR